MVIMQIPNRTVRFSSTNGDLPLQKLTEAKKMVMFLSVI